MTRPLARFGWTAQDEARAARIRAERGPIILDEVDFEPWKGELPRWPGLQPWGEPLSVTETPAGGRLTVYRNAVMISTPPRENPPWEG